ncbi:MAG: MBL fold metallo-hydrolase [Bacteroidaceae bacterium]|nr:MBL fold metallo-hydrolase [Bacteroidaceae bacterium]
MKIKKFEFNMFPVNCFVLSDETNEAVIIDAGCFYPEEKQRLKDYIESNGLTVKHVLNTHLHLDHVFGNPFLFQEYGLRPEGGEQDEFWLGKVADMARNFGFMYEEQQPTLGKYLHEGDTVTFGNTELKVIHVPGHSPGSLVYYNEKDACLFSGDVLFEGSIGRADLAGGNFNELVNGIRTKLFVLPEETRVYPGHGYDTSIGYEKNNNPFFR